MMHDAGAIANTIASELRRGDEDSLKFFKNTLTGVIRVDSRAKNTQASGGCRDRVLCLRELLAHLCNAGLGDAFFVFQNCGGTVNLFRGWHRDSPIHLSDSMRSVASELRKSVKTTEELNGGASVQELTRIDLQRLLPSKHSSFAQGFLIKTRMTPLWKSPDMHLVIYILGTSGALDVGFATSWLQAILPMWFNTFLAGLDSYERCLARHATKQDVANGAMTIIGRAQRAYPWLTSAEVRSGCEMTMLRCEALRSASPDEERDAPPGDPAEEMTNFGKAWDWCQERPLPCEGPYPAERHPMLDWFLWRLDAENAPQLKEAIEASRDFVANEMMAQGMPTQLDEILWKAVCAEFLRGFLAKDPLPHPNTRDFRNAKNHLGRFAALVLSGAHLTPDCVEATIWTLAQYAYKVLEVDPGLHIASHMRHGARGEPSLHMMKEFYRGHFFHTIEVCFLGHLLLMACPENGTAAFRSTESLLRQWYIAALLHDMGYAVDVCKSMRDWLGFFASGSFNGLGGQLDRALSKMKKSDELDTFYKQFGFSEKDKPWEDHGLLGAQHLQTLIDDVKPRHKTAEAIEAIAKHSCSSVPIRYEPGVKSLPALLVLCDLLQSWRRPQFPHFSVGPAWMMSAMSTHEKHIRPETANARLRSNVKFERVGSRVVPQFANVLVLRLEFDDEVNRDSYVFNIWLDATRNLQRIDFSELPHDILVQLVTPTYTPPGARVPLRQMDRLRDVAAETHMAYLAKWFPPNEEQEGKTLPSIADITGTEDWIDLPMSYHVEYDQDGEPRREMLSFSLKRFDGTLRLMTESLSRFRADLKNWQFYGQDRTLQGDYSPWRHRSE